MAVTMTTLGAKLNPRGDTKWFDYSIYLYALGDGSGGEVNGVASLTGLRPTDRLFLDGVQLWTDTGYSQKCSAYIMGTEWEAIQGLGKLYLVIAQAWASTEDGTADAWIYLPTWPNGHNPPFYLGRPTVAVPSVTVPFGANTNGKIYRAMIKLTGHRPQ